jgi:archaellum component FlaC
MAAMTIEAILERVQELKNECQEKDEVIRDQQVQIMELEEKMNELVARYKEQSAQVAEISAAACKADELMEKLSEALA